MLIPEKLYCKEDYILKAKESSGYIYTGMHLQLYILQHFIISEIIKLFYMYRFCA